MRDALRDTLDLIASSLSDALASLEGALRSGRPLIVRALDGPDCLAAAIIVRHVLNTYLGLAVGVIGPLDDAAPGAFILTLGDEAAVDENGLGIGSMATRTVHLTVATRAWRLMQMLLMGRENPDEGRFLIVDIETSARHTEHAELVEVGALPFAAGEAEDGGLFTLVRPSSPAAIAPEATDVHGLRWNDVVDSPEPCDVLPPLIALMHEHVVVGHNVEEFDLPVLRQCAKRAGLSLQPPLTIDTRRMAERLWPDEASYRLEDLARRWDPAAVQAHRARHDCLLAADLFANLLASARRDREIDVLAECLPLVAASIIAGNFVVVHDNALLTALGARALSFGHGTRLWSEWAAGATPAAAVVHARLTTFLVDAPDEDEAWERFRDAWRTAVAAFCSGASDRGIGHFLHYAALAQPIDSLPRAPNGNAGTDPRTLVTDERVALMTVHSAKGLEWPVVFVVGVEDDQFPLYRHASSEQLAEERRTLYVGMTRARDRLFLFSTRQRDGRAKHRSRFLGQLIGDTVVPVRPRQGENDS